MPGNPRSSSTTSSTVGVLSPPTSGTSTTTTTNPPPQIFIPPTAGVPGPQVPIWFLVADPTNQRVRVDVTYDSGAGPQTAQAAIGSDAMDGLAAPYLWAAYRFVWDLSPANLQDGPVTVQMKVSRGGDSSAASVQFDVAPGGSKEPSISPGPVQPLPPPVTPALALVSPTLPFIGVSGQLFPAPIVVSVTDSASPQKSPLTGVRVEFSTTAGSPPLHFETSYEGGLPAPTAGSAGGLVCDGSGTVSIFLRALPGSIGDNGTIEVRVAGSSAPPLQIPYSIDSPVLASRFVAPPWADQQPALIPPNKQFGFLVYIDKIQYSIDPCQPIELQVTASAGIVVCTPKLLIVGTHSWDTSHNGAWLSIFPTAGGITGSVTVTCRADPSVKPLVIDNLVVNALPPDVTFQRLTGVTFDPQNGDQYQTSPMTLVLERMVIPTPAGQLIGHPGLQLAENFAVIVRDLQGNSYDQEFVSDSPALPMDLAAGHSTNNQIDALLVTYSCNLGGTFSSPGVADGNGSISAPAGKEVYYTPATTGPWLINASVSLRSGFYICDTHPVAYEVHAQDDPADPSSPWQTQAFTRYGLGGIPNDVSFLVLEPVQVQLMTKTVNDPVPTGSIAPGDHVFLQIDGLSPVRGGNATPWNVAYSGAPVTTLNLTLNGNSLVSEDLVLVPDIDGITPPSTKHITFYENSVLRFGFWYTAWAGTELLLAALTTVRVYSRKPTGNTPAPQESLFGNTPAGAFGGTVLLRNGAFLYGTQDLSIPTATGQLTIARTFRGQTRSNGPIGPGWFFGHGLYRQRDRYIDGSGREVGLNEQPAMPQVQIPGTSESALSDESGHTFRFYNDGSLKLVSDRFNNRTTYIYNAKGQLTSIQDMHGRPLTLDYYEESDGVSPETVGRLKTVTDFANRVVDYEYYLPNDPDGASGWLKTVYLPPAATLPPNATTVDPNYRRSETYKYNVNPSDPLDGELREIIDSSKTVLLHNDYDGNRVKTQTSGGATVSFRYDPPTSPPPAAPPPPSPAPPNGWRTTVTDAAGHQTTYMFADSPFADGAVPLQVVRKGGSGIGGRGDLTDSYQNDPLGRTVGITNAAGDTGVIKYHNSQIQLVPYEIQWTSAAQDVRKWTISYFSASPWLVNRVVEPRGNIPGVNPEIYATRYYYSVYTIPDNPDYPQTACTLDRVEPPSTLRMTVTSPGDQNHAYAATHAQSGFKWNRYGLLTRETDPQGVVTAHRYYPIGDPTGAQGGAATENGGGLIAEIERDVQDTDAAATRQSWHGNLPLTPRLTKWRYNNLGAVCGMTDPAGVSTDLTPNALGELCGVTFAANSSGAPALSISRSFDLDWRGLMARTTLSNAGLTDSYDYDAAGVPAGHRLGTPDGEVRQSVVPDTNHAIIKLRPAELESGRFASCGSEIVQDERGLPQQYLEGTAASFGATSGSALRTTQFSRSDGGLVTGIELPGSEKHRVFPNGFGEPHAVVDPLGNAFRSISDRAGMPTRTVAYAGNGTPLADGDDVSALNGKLVAHFSERFHLETGPAYRWHEGSTALLDPSDPAPPDPSQKIAAAPEYLAPMESMAAGSWPFAALSSLADGDFGKGDGRYTFDRLLDAFGLPSRILSDSLDYLSIRRDTHARPIEIADAGNSSWTCAYDPNGHIEQLSFVARASDGSGVTRTFTSEIEYDALGRVVRQSDAAGNSVRCKYALDGSILEVSDAQNNDTETSPTNLAVTKAGNTTTFRRDGYGRLREVKMTLAIGGSVSSTGALDTNDYNLNGATGMLLDYEDQPLAPAPGAPAAPPAAPARETLYAGAALRFLTDQAGKTTQFDYDDFGRLVTITYPGSAASQGQPTTVSLEYAPGHGRLAFHTDANKCRLHYEWDAQDRVTGVHIDSFPASVDSKAGDGMTFSYPPGLTVATVDRTGHSCRIAEDAIEGVHREVQGPYEIVSQNLPNGRTLNYPKDQNGNAAKATFVYDAARRLQSAADSVNIVASFVYLGRTLILSRTVCGLTTSFTYDDTRPLVNKIATEGVLAGATFQNIEFAMDQPTDRDRTGRIASRRRSAGGVTEERTWTYDSAGRIVTETYTPGPSRGFAKSVTTRLYDGDTVLRKETRQITSPGGAVSEITRERAREERGRVISMTDKGSGTTTTYLYDLAGNLVDDGLQQYKYDAWNRLTQVLRGGAAVAVYDYDALHRCIRRSAADGSSEEYVYDGWRLIQVHANGAVVEQYVYGDDTDDLLWVDSGGFRYTYLYSPEGWIDALIGAQQNLIERYDYDLNGQVTVLDVTGAPLVDGQGRPAMPRSRFLFQRQPFDTLVGLYHCRTRWYHPLLGQFMMPDPAILVGGANHYAFNHGDPVNFHDPFGMQDEGTGYKKGTPVRVDRSNEHWLEFHSSDFKEGVKGGASILFNTLTFGFTDKIGLTQSDKYQGAEYGPSRVTAVISRECLITAATLGTAELANAARGSTTAVEALENSSTMVRWTARVGQAASRIAPSVVTTERLGLAANVTAQGLGAFEVLRGGSTVGEGISEIRQGHIAGGLFDIGMGLLQGFGGFGYMRNVNGGGVSGFAAWVNGIRQGRWRVFGSTIPRLLQGRFGALMRFAVDRFDPNKEKWIRVGFNRLSDMYWQGRAAGKALHHWLIPNRLNLGRLSFLKNNVLALLETSQDLNSGWMGSNAVREAAFRNFVLFLGASEGFSVYSLINGRSVHGDIRRLFDPNDSPPPSDPNHFGAQPPR